MINISIPHKDIIKSFDSSSFNSYFENGADSLNNSTNINSQKNEFDEIIKLMNSETELNITRFDIKLGFYIRKNPKIKNDIIEKIITTLNSNSNIYYRAIIKCINCILDLLIENFQIISLLNNTIPFILSILFQEDNIKNLEIIREINEFLGKLISILYFNILSLKV